MQEGRLGRGEPDEEAVGEESVEPGLVKADEAITSHTRSLTQVVAIVLALTH